mmetsp:Transcript_23757/g.34040  ORF Transcript_23757/g.34040 Transcript_23757/m.34040 type:complete len:814 (-) Transcript_23757:101-2542(-)|eukprot:CAMPEP_0172427548 /NCGR_PEP_ID=MMETSP1064-20121228/42474_1 /TAXON_ID=202472 /ORGANISM="Aulacoseira subarctica , Strain CCAP 1002/5" /LENGTH=813 /DNA_ID=CAMNT_0013171791 /DNA_START=132 /DNA_END=2573 /DNA_ORIENTATION=+
MPSLVKAISKIFGGGNKKSRNGASSTPASHHPDTRLSHPIDIDKAEKANKKAIEKAQKKAAKNKGKHTSTSFPSSPYSAEIRIPGKLYVPAPAAPSTSSLKTPTGTYQRGQSHLGQVVAVPLSENNQKLNSPVNSRVIPSKSSLQSHSAAPQAKHISSAVPNLRSQRYFSDEDEDSENHGLGGKKQQTHPYSSTLNSKFLNDFSSLSPSPNLAYLDTPTSSSDFCLSSDVEDEEYNRVKYQSNAGLLRPIAFSTSTEDESALFPALEGKGTGSVTSPPISEGASDPEESPLPANHFQRANAVGSKMPSSSQKQHAQERRKGPLYREAPEAELDADDVFSPSSRASPHHSNRAGNNVPAAQSRFFPNQHQSPLPRSSRSNALSEAFGFEQFVVNDWPAHIAADSETTTPVSQQRRTGSSKERKSKNIISFDAGEFGDTTNAGGLNAMDTRKDSKDRSGGSVASAPLDHLLSNSRPYSSNRVIASPGRVSSRSVAVPSRPSPSSYRSQVGSAIPGNSRLLDKLERELRDRSIGNTSSSNKASSIANKGSISRGAHRSNDQDNDATRRGDSGQNPDQWLMEEVTDTLGPRGTAADLESLSGRSTRSKTDRSIGGKSHRSHKSRSTRKNHQSSGNSVTSRSSHYSTHTYMSEASRSVANDLLRLEMQLAMVGSERNTMAGSSNITEAMAVASSTASVGGSSRSKRGVSGRHSRSSPSANRKTVIAPSGKLGLILANKSDGKGTVVSGVRSGSALSESMSIGDRIVAVDGEDVSLMNVAELTTIMTRKSDFERKLSVMSFSKSAAPSPVSRTREVLGS